MQARSINEQTALHATVDTIPKGSPPTNDLTTFASHALVLRKSNFVTHSEFESKLGQKDLKCHFKSCLPFCNEVSLIRKDVSNVFSEFGTFR